MSAAAADWLAPELTRMAFCWRLDRRDGVSLGFTSHDRDLVVAGLVYAAAPGMVPSAVTRSTGFAVASLDVSGALTDDRISAGDLAAGRWDGAAVRLFAVDWSDPDGVAVPLARGEIGDVDQRDGGFVAELRGPTALLERPVVERTSPECRAALGDARCRVDMAGRVRIARILRIVDARTLMLDGMEPVANGWGGGRTRWLDGAGSGLAIGVLRSDGATVTLRDPPRWPVAAGERVELTEGCDRRLATCAARFGNAVHFRGEPHLPGNDLLTRYPGE
jgi:uncharacterized phage protein (TIGR02218 family)